MSNQDPDHFYKRVSLELNSTWPGEVYLRLEPNIGPAIMVRVLPGDIVAISHLGEDGVTSVEVEPNGMNLKTPKTKTPGRKFVGPWPDQPGPRTDR